MAAAWRPSLVRPGLPRRPWKRHLGRLHYFFSSSASVRWVSATSLAAAPQPMSKATGGDAKGSKDCGDSDADSEGPAAPPFVDVIERCKARFGKPDDLAVLAAFVDKHARDFANIRADDLLKSEHDLDHTRLHQEYLNLWEKEMETFLRDEDVDLVDFQQQLFDALNDNYTALFEEHPHHGWVDSALAAISYEHFFARMVAAADDDRSDHK